jgi:adenylate cyclase class 2
VLASGAFSSNLDTIVLGGNSIVTTDNLEIEIKLGVDGPVADVHERLQSAGFAISKPRVFESNTLFDTTDLRLRGASELIRLRRVGAECILTYKGRPEPGKHKSREEIETGVSEESKMELILARLGFGPVFRYEKFRTEYQSGQEGTITVDETPIGLYLEIEGAPGWIDRIAGELGFSERQYITKSYGALYLDYCREREMTAANMVFP